MRGNALIVMFVVLGSLGCSSSEEARFSFADDDLCEWVSEEQVAEWVAAEFEWNGTAVVEARYREEAPCRWVLAGTEVGEVSVHDVAQWKDFDGNPYAVPEAEVVEYEGGTVDIGAVVDGHRAVSDAVVIHNGGFGQFAFGVPPGGEWLQLMLILPDEQREWDEAYEARYFALADRFVQELGWLEDR